MVSRLGDLDGESVGGIKGSRNNLKAEISMYLKSMTE